MEVTHQSGLSRLMNSILCALCVSPALLIGMVFLLGWNEKRAVCEMRAILEGQDKVEQVGCTDANEMSGELVMFKCDMQQTGLTPVQLSGTDFSFSYVGPLAVTAEMLQCVEHKSSRTEKDSVGGGTTTVTTYTYSVEWRSSYLDSGSYQGKNLGDSRFSIVCGTENPQWPGNAPTTGTIPASGDMLAGPYKLGDHLDSYLTLSAAVSPSSTPAGWTQASGSYTKSSSGPNGIGNMRVSFKGFNWNAPMVTVLGQNNAGEIGKWTASDSWLCSGFKLLALEMGATDVDKFFENMQASSQVLTYILRFVGFIVMWCAFAAMFGPLSVAADCIPCVGPYLGDAIETIACVVSCPPACACALGVIGVVWVVMRPMVGVPLMIIFCCIMGGFVAYEVKMKGEKGGSSGGGDGEDAA